MNIKKRSKQFVMISVLCIALILCIPQTAYGTDYAAGQSLVAKDQEKASRGLSFPGLDITWLDLGDDYLRYFSPMPNQFAEGMFALPIGLEMVIFDTSGKIISAGNYDEVGRYSDGMALVRKQLPLTDWKPGELSAPPGYRSGYIDLTGKEVIPLGKFNGLEAEFHEGLAVLGAYSEKKGYINKAGEIVIPQIYLNAGDFSEGLAPVQSSGTKLWGYIDKTGALIIPMEYEGAKPFHDGVACVTKNGLTGYIDNTGKTAIDFKFKVNASSDVDGSFYDGLAAASDDNGKYGYIDKSGDFVIPAKYLAAEPFRGEMAFVTSENSAYNNGYGSSFLINRKGERVTPLWCYGYYAGEKMESGLIRVLYPYGTNSNQFIAVLNQYGAEVMPSSLKIENISPFNEGSALLICFDKDGKLAVGLAKKPENIEEKKSGRLIKVYIDGKQLDFTDTDPVIENSRTMVPMRAVFESLGAEVRWDAANNVVSGTKDGITVSLKIGDSKGYINGEAVNLDAPAKIQNARTLVPLRFVAESFHADVAWDNAARTVRIDTN